MTIYILIEVQATSDGIVDSFVEAYSTEEAAKKEAARLRKERNLPYGFKVLESKLKS